jgi:hypothetical protein
MPLTEPTQLSFAGGLNASAPGALIADDEVATATNLDFSLERGGATVRQGAQVVSTIGTCTLQQMFTHWRGVGIWDDFIYFTLADEPLVAGSGYIYRGVREDILQGTAPTLISTNGSERVGMGRYKDHVYIAAMDGAYSIKDDGTTTVEWVKQQPPAPLTTVVSTLSALTVTASFTCVEGTSTSGTATFTADVDPTTLRLQLTSTLGTATNLNINGTSTIGDYGIDTVYLSFSNPSVVRKVSRDYSIGDTSFSSYWHTEMDVNIGWTTITDDSIVDGAVADSLTLANSQDFVGTSTDTNVDSALRQDLINTALRTVRVPRTIVSAAKDSPNAWSVPRTKFQLVNASSNPEGWENIGAVRIIVETDDACTVVVQDWTINGAVDFPITDADLGVSYWETFATLDTNGAKLDESAPSPSSARLRVQGARVVVTSTNTATGTSHGITHRVFYRQGGYLPDGYAVATLPLATATFTDSLSDLQALTNNFRLERNLVTAFPNLVQVVAEEPYQDRIFFAELNHVRWSLPSRPGSIPRTSVVTVSYEGDKVNGLIVTPQGLIIINRDSVYELSGQTFEGNDSNYILRKTNCTKGSCAPKTIIKTPYGIPLLNATGLTMYNPGQGVDQPLAWARRAMLDVFRGGSPSDAAALKGNRIPAACLQTLNNSCAGWADEKLYLALPCGEVQYSPNYVFVLDFSSQQVQVYKYPFDVSCFVWEPLDGKMFVGTPNGRLVRIENSSYDTDESSTSIPITWSMTSKTWTTPADAVLENLFLEHKGGTCTVVAQYDGNISTVGTLTATGKDWFEKPLLGTVANSIFFQLNGSQPFGDLETLYGLHFEALVEPKRVEFWKTEYDINNYDGEKIWDVHFADLEIIASGTVLGTVFVDGTAVSTNTYVGASNGRQLYPNSLPVDSFGDVAHVIYRSSAGALFKHWKTSFQARNEPPRTNSYKSDIESLEENICDAMDVDIDPNGTVLSTVYVDHVSVGTYTTTGTGRQSYTFALPGGNTIPHGLYGRTLYVIHNGTSFKHYKTWFHLRPEPDRWTNFMSERTSTDENFWQTFECDIDPLGGVVYNTVICEGTAVATYTMSGAGRQSFAWSIPEDIYGRTIYSTYTCSGAGKFKHYRTWFTGTPEPDRLSLVQHGPIMFPSNQNLRTWIVDLNPLGTCTGILYLDHVAVSTATFTGTNRTVFNVGLDVDTTIALRTVAYEMDVTYHAIGSGAKLKHYDTKFETVPKPFGKKTWSVTYRHFGGATQLDLARFWSYDIECVGTATFTSIWDLDGEVFQTSTHTLTGREWADRIPFEPGARGYLFQQRLLSDVDIKVHKVNLDIMQVGIKGLSRRSYSGSPTET